MLIMSPFCKSNSTSHVVHCGEAVQLLHRNPPSDASLEVDLLVLPNRNFVCGGQQQLHGLL